MEIPFTLHNMSEFTIRYGPEGDVYRHGIPPGDSATPEVGVFISSPAGDARVITTTPPTTV